MTIIPTERGYRLHEAPAEYGPDTETADLLTNIPLPLGAP